MWSRIPFPGGCIHPEKSSSSCSCLLPRSRSMTLVYLLALWIVAIPGRTFERRVQTALAAQVPVPGHLSCQLHPLVDLYQARRFPVRDRRSQVDPRGNSLWRGQRSAPGLDAFLRPMLHRLYFHRRPLLRAGEARPALPHELCAFALFPAGAHFFRERIAPSSRPSARAG